MLRLLDSSKPAFYRAAGVIREYLPDVIIAPTCKIIESPGRYYGLITPDGCTVIYDHVIIDKFVCNPEFIFKVLTTVFQFGDIMNTFVERDNTASRRFLDGLGFVHTGFLRQDTILEIYSMTAQEWENNRVRRHFIEKQTQKETTRSGIA